MNKLFTENGATFGVGLLFVQDRSNVINATDIDGVFARLKDIFENKRKGKFIGIIDNDKRKPKFHTRFKKVSDNRGVIVEKFENLYLIALSPQVDEFLFTNAIELNLNFSKYEFASDLKNFIKQMKKFGIDGNAGFKDFTNDLKQKRASCFVALHEAFDFINSQK